MTWIGGGGASWRTSGGNHVVTHSFSIVEEYAMSQQNICVGWCEKREQKKKGKQYYCDGRNPKIFKNICFAEAN